MRKLFTPLAALACSALFLAGCSSYDHGVITAGMGVELTGIERAADGTVTVGWNLVNPNITPYLLDHVSQKVYLNGTLVGTTLDAARMAVPAQQTTSKVSRLTTAGPAADQIIAEAAAKGSAAYRVDMQLQLRLYDDLTDKATLTHAGTVPVTNK
jgi:hypothetical protein